MTESLVRSRVYAELNRCIDVATKRYPDHNFKFPNLTYTLKGTTAGTANDRTYTVDLNMIIMVDNMHSIEDTTAHEFAHLVDGIVNPHTRKTTGYGRYRTKRSIHGPTWKSIMVLFGMKPERCHNLDTTRAQQKSGKKSTKIHKWVCGCGNGQVVLTPKKHKLMLDMAHNGYGVYKRGHTPSKCGVYTYQGILGDVQQLPVAAKDIKPTKKSTSKKSSKLDMCRELYAQNSDQSRSEIILRFVLDASCTQAGAQTYYAKIKKEMSN